MSPLLANAYLDTFDHWINKQWEQKQTEYKYADKRHRIRALKKTKLRPAYLIRYADDWVIVTNNKRNAEEWKRSITTFLKDKLQLELSAEKTLITNVRKDYVKFLGYEYKLVKTSNENGFITRTVPNRQKLRSKIITIHQEIKRLRRFTRIEDVIHHINLINSKIRGLINYYENATWVHIILRKYSRILGYAGINSLKRFNGQWKPANKVNNLNSIHMNYKTQLATITYFNSLIGITCIGFCKWKRVHQKIPDETPYSHLGRQIYISRTGKKPLKIRADELLTTQLSELISRGLTRRIYNFEYYLNRAYAFNRDKGKCKVCGEEILNNLETHHVDPKLSLDLINRVPNLISTHKTCHQMIHDNKDHSNLENQTWKKISALREKLIYT
ncbi:group II intron reverse transcriptase [Paenibacillus aceris]|uniref:group II intron reverse transcriptase n=1 Tax=Paenibacillus aceris TaxID=869555 RepID=UPI0030B8E571